MKKIVAALAIVGAFATLAHGIEGQSPIVAQNGTISIDPTKLSGNTDELCSYDGGAVTGGNLAVWDANGNLTDGGAPGGGSNPFPMTSAELAADITDETGTGKVVFGTNPSLVRPQVVKDGTTEAYVLITNTNQTNSNGPRLILTQGTDETNGQVLTSDVLGNVDYRGLTDTGAQIIGARVQATAMQDWTSGNNGTDFRIYVTPENGGSLQNRFALYGNGKSLWTVDGTDGVEMDAAGVLTSKNGGYIIADGVTRSDGNAATIQTTSGNADISISPHGTGNVGIQTDTVNFTDGDITIATTSTDADIILTPDGNGIVRTDNMQLGGSTVSTISENNLNLNPQAGLSIRVNSDGDANDASVTLRTGTGSSYFGQFDDDGSFVLHTPNATSGAGDGISMDTSGELTALNGGKIVATDAAASTIDAISEIDATVRKGSSGAKLATATAASVTGGNLAVWDANGDLVDGGSPSGGGVPSCGDNEYLGIEPGGASLACLTGTQYSARDFGATLDGSTDDTSSIQDGIDELTALGGGVLVVDGEAAISSDVELKDGVSIKCTGEDGGFTALSGTYTTAMLVASGSSVKNVTVQGCAIDANSNADVGIDIDGSGTFGFGGGPFNIVDNSFTGLTSSSGTGRVYVTGGMVLGGSTTVRGNRFIGSGTDASDNTGVKLTGGGDVSNNQFTDFDGAMINLPGGSWRVSNNYGFNNSGFSIDNGIVAIGTISNNTLALGDINDAGIKAGGAQTTVVGNSINGSDGNLYADGGFQTAFSGNLFSIGDATGFYLTGTGSSVAGGGGSCTANTAGTVVDSNAGQVMITGVSSDLCLNGVISTSNTANTRVVGSNFYRIGAGIGIEVLTGWHVSGNTINWMAAGATGLQVKSTHSIIANNSIHAQNLDYDPMTFDTSPTQTFGGALTITGNQILALGVSGPAMDFSLISSSETIDNVTITANTFALPTSGATDAISFDGTKLADYTNFEIGYNSLTDGDLIDNWQASMGQRSDQSSGGGGGKQIAMQIYCKAGTCDDAGKFIGPIATATNASADDQERVVGAGNLTQLTCYQDDNTHDIASTYAVSLNGSTVSGSGVTVSAGSAVTSTFTQAVSAGDRIAVEITAAGGSSAGSSTRVRCVIYAEAS